MSNASAGRSDSSSPIPEIISQLSVVAEPVDLAATAGLTGADRSAA
jgi:hypothetical protein